MGVQSEDKCDCGRKLTGESARARDISRSGVIKVRNEVTLLGGDLARIGELGRFDVCQHHRAQRMIVDEAGDPERCDLLMVLTTSERHLHHPIGVRDEIVATIHDVRFDSFHQSKLILEMWERRRMKLKHEQNHT